MDTVSTAIRSAAFTASAAALLAITGCGDVDREDEAQAPMAQSATESPAEIGEEEQEAAVAAGSDLRVASDEGLPEGDSAAPTTSPTPGESKAVPATAEAAASAYEEDNPMIGMRP